MLSDENLKKAVEGALRKVIDPELGASLMDLGMIKSVYVKDHVAVIEMTLTTPFCPLVGFLTSEVRKAAEGVKGISRAEVRVVDFRLLSFPR